MTKWGSPTFIGCKGVIFIIIIIAGMSFAPAYSQAQNISLVLQQTPAKGGEITPAAGVHHFSPNSEITLKAVPRPGYKFVHWLGDVSDPTTNKTVVYLNKPKIVIAVFEQTDNDTPIDKEDLNSGGGGGGAGGGLMPTATDLSRPGGFSAGGGGGMPKPKQIIYVDLPSKDTTPKVPEPTTGVLLVLGGLFTFIRRRVKPHS